MNNLPDLIDTIFGKIKPLVLRSSLAMKVAFYIAQQYILAKEFIIFTNKLEEMEINADIWLAHFLRLREIAKLMSYLAAELAYGYKVLEAYLEEYWELEDASTQNPNNISVDQVNFVEIIKSLKLLECESAAIQRLNDDWQDLYQELQAFVSRVEQIVSTSDLSPIQIVSILHDLVYPWSNTGWHALYHLGNYEDIDADLYHPGFLGETLIIIEQLSVAVTKQLSASSKLPPQ